LETDGIEHAARQAGIRAVVPKSEAWDLIRTIETAVNRGPNQ
jgi:hypothetical protein